MSRFDRQSFLGPNSEETLRSTRLMVVGLGGGGSHVVEQAAHIGFGDFIIIDPDVVDETNLNRLVGATTRDARVKRPKVQVARRVIRGLASAATVVAIKGTWQSSLAVASSADLVISCLDSAQAKIDLEGFCRRMLVPMIDIGMDVHQIPGGHLIAGQVVLSNPGGPCLRCLGVVSEEQLAQEARHYGAAGSRPQVIWPNGVLASTAVGLAVRLMTPWHENAPLNAYLEYDGNLGTVRSSHRLARIGRQACMHHSASEAGQMLFDIRVPPSAAR